MEYFTSVRGELINRARDDLVEMRCALRSAEYEEDDGIVA
ncbi:unannotated protein [freshwater metagenome]|uniref:Unannotated protein n=1 Tax=freshwater metagenome TaxID=449393 RepID=A0A6J7R7Q7_9ZZZZ